MFMLEKLMKQIILGSVVMQTARGAPVMLSKILCEYQE